MSGCSSPSNSSSLSSASESEHSFHDDEVAEHPDDYFVPYEEELEPLATQEEAAEYQEIMEQEGELEREYQQRYNKEVDVNTWCFCSHCSVECAMKPEECQCCKEIDRCGELMASIDQEGKCITLHPGFRDVCLNKYVLEVAAIGLKTKAGKSYKTLFSQGHRSEEQFLRSIAYRQFTRLVWDYLGNSKRYPLPCCAYKEIRKQFPSGDGQYQGFEDEDGP